jgi:hypothetical protein
MQPGGSFGPFDVLTVLMLRVVLAGVVGVTLSKSMWVFLGPLAAIGAAVLWISGVLYLATRRDLPTRVLALTAVALSAVIYLVSVGLRWTSDTAPLPGQLGDVAARLTVFPVLLVIVALALVLDGADPRVRPSLWGGIVVASLILGTVVIGIDFFSHDNRRDIGPDWPNSVAMARQACIADKTLVDVIVPITPSGWTVWIDCQRLIGSS